MPPRPKIALAASIVAFFLTATALVTSVTTHVITVPAALIPLLAGIGIARKRAWAAYGFGIFEFVQMINIAIVQARRADGSNTVWTVLAGLIVWIGLVVLFLQAGRSLQAAGFPRGAAWPWISAAIISVVPYFAGRPFIGTTGYMENTVLGGEYMYVQVFPKSTPVRGNLAAFFYPVDRQYSSLSRIIGIPGDRIHLSNKILFRNGVQIDEPYAIHTTDYIDLYRDNFPGEPYTTLPASGIEMLSKNVVNGEVLVPAGHYFLLGDNRDRSFDSRYWGFITPPDIIGRPRLIVDSKDGHKIRWNRLFKIL